MKFTCSFSVIMAALLLHSNPIEAKDHLHHRSTEKHKTKNGAGATNNSTPTSSNLPSSKAPFATSSTKTPSKYSTNEPSTEGRKIITRRRKNTRNLRRIEWKISNLSSKAPSGNSSTQAPANISRRELSTEGRKVITRKRMYVRQLRKVEQEPIRSDKRLLYLSMKKTKAPSNISTKAPH